VVIMRCKHTMTTDVNESLGVTLRHGAWLRRLIDASVPWAGDTVEERRDRMHCAAATVAADLRVFLDMFAVETQETSL